MFNSKKFYSIFTDPDDNAPLENLYVVKNGFNIWAFLFSGLWALFNKLWPLFFIYILFNIVIFAGITTGHFNDMLINILGVLFSLWAGLEGTNMIEEKYSKKGFVLVDLIYASNEDDARIKYISKYSHLETYQASYPKKSGTFIFDNTESVKPQTSDSFA